jgi:hypothetical protein
VVPSTLRRGKRVSPFYASSTGSTEPSPRRPRKRASALGPRKSVSVNGRRGEKAGMALIPGTSLGCNRVWPEVYPNGEVPLFFTTCHFYTFLTIPSTIKRGADCRGGPRSKREPEGHRSSPQRKCTRVLRAGKGQQHGNNGIRDKVDAGVDGGSGSRGVIGNTAPTPIAMHGALRSFIASV